MTDDEKLHDEAADIRAKTAKDAPEVAEHDHVADLEKQLEEAKTAALYAAAETQNVRRRLETELQQATSYAAAQFARDMLAIKDHLERVRMLLDELEEAQEIARLLEGARDAPGCRIFIGSENRMFALSGSSVIAAPYRGSQGQVVGVVGVIGPTRLNYARVVPMVDFTAKALTRLMA